MKELIPILVVILSILIVFTLIYNINNMSETKIETKSYMSEIEITPQNYLNKTRATIIKVPAVDKDGNGVMATLSVEANSGAGRTLVDINQITFWADTQNSIRTAKYVAENLTGIDLSNYDILYSIQANASAIEGPSAGAAMGVATVLELENKTFRNDVSITGTLDEYGNVGQVSGIIEKAKAAKDEGMNLFLVPKGQKIYTSYVQEKKCENYILTTICRTETVPKTFDVEKQVGITVEEVKNVQEALKYFI